MVQKLLKKVTEEYLDNSNDILPQKNEGPWKLFYQTVLSKFELFTKKQPINCSPKSDDVLKDLHIFPESSFRYKRGDAWDVLKDVTLAGNAITKFDEEFILKDHKLGRYCIELAEFGRTYSIAKSVKGTLASMEARGFEMEFSEEIDEDFLQRYGETFIVENPLHVYSNPKQNLTKGYIL